MNRAKLPDFVLLLPLWSALGVALAALAATALAALFAPHDGIPLSPPPLGNLSAVAHSYLFRNALRNTALVVAAVCAAMFVIARVASPRLRAHDRRPLWLYALAITPLFIPAPYAAIHWRSLFARVDVVNQPDMALLALALVQVWRLWPLAIVAAPLVAHAGPNRAAAAITAAAAAFVLLDGGTPLAATGGEPFNETHVWASWGFHTLWVSRHWGSGAAMACGLAGAAALIGALLWFALRAECTATSHLEYRPSSAAGTVVVAVGAALAALPLVLSAPGVADYGLSRAISELGQAGYWGWALNSVAVLCVASSIAALIVLPAKASDATRRPIRQGIALAAGVTLPALIGWMALRYDATGAGVVGLAVFGVAAGVNAGLISVWVVRSARTARFHGITAALVAVAALIAGNQLALEVSMAGRGYTGLGSGAMLHLAGAWSSQALDAAAVATFVVTFVAILLVAQAFRIWSGKAAAG